MSQRICPTRWHPGLLSAALSLLFTVASALAQSPVDIIGNLPLTDYNTYVKPQSYNDWGNEPFIAVNPLNTQQIVVSSFAYSSPSASLWYSTNGGATWGIRFPISSPISGVTVPEDQTFAYDSSGTLHGVFLGGDSSGNTNIYQGSTVNPNNDGFNGRPASNWTWAAQGQINNAAVNSTTADQPWLAISGSHVYAAYDNFNSTFTASEERIVQSTDNGATFATATDTAITSGGRLTTNSVNPGLRLGSDHAGHIYSIVGINKGDLGNSVHTIDYRLNQLTVGNTAFDYTSTGTNPGGLTLDTGTVQSQQGNTTQALSFGGKNVLLGNITSVAASSDGTHVYGVYGKQDGSSVDRLYLAAFDRVSGNLVERAGAGLTPFSIAGERSALPSVAVSANGTIGVLYQTTSGTDVFEVHFALSNNLGLTFVDQLLATYSTANIALQNGNNRLLGDYEYLTSVGDTFYGTYPATGNLNAGGINTTTIISPFFFVISVPEPSTWTLFGVGLLGFMVTVRRQRPA